jgi:hypothetical protein
MILHDLSRWRFLRYYRIPFSQFVQRPGSFDHLPGNRTVLKGLYLAGDIRNRAASREQWRAESGWQELC